MPSEFVFPPRLNLALQPTPLDFLSRLSAELGLRIWCKRDDLTGGVLTGNKIRKLEYVLADALACGADTLLTCGGLQSNHCRATALLAAKEGLNCELILRGEPGLHDHDANLLLSELAGATIHTYPAAVYQPQLFELAREHRARLEAEGKTPYWIATGASDGVGVWGYIRAARELANDCLSQGITAPLVVCAAGSGGTLAGLAVGLARYLPRARVLAIAVCDDATYFEGRVGADIAACQQRWPDAGVQMPDNFQVCDDYIGPGYGEAGAEIYQLISQLARQEGLVLDQVYTAKAFYGMLQELRLGRIDSKDCIFVHTGGVFGLFAAREHFYHPNNFN
ncbi:MAG TPA: D-cysteine desulfhydrase family protein [Cellvibrionaceae bacterium]